MGYELELRVSPGLSSLTEHLRPLLRGLESICASGVSDTDGKPYCAISTDKDGTPGGKHGDAPGGKPDWPHRCEFVLEAPGRIYVLAHLGADLDIAERLAAHLRTLGYGVEVSEP
ncbi:hypothetical protein KDH83_11885 [Achromobacter sp. Marseille-Q0513]|uniref:hypothetical protein n=1 Tax=Achromobacter sp. Marseille-Q0513 TaxID=2829161 RepID=UPI001B8E0918|nr:hypothetical protein [Achromobacter sp. Marseille-Q0513]MBR8654002.1 hypothetical protein [Achromobacter sp. Marseille-Q0513]